MKVALPSGFPHYESKRLPAPSAGKVILAPTGYTAFIPAKPPPTLTYDDQFVLSLSRADAALSELSGLGRHLPNPHLLIAPYVRREAVLSSRIEGTRASLSDLLIDEMEEPKQRTEDRDVQEVRNYIAAMERGLERLQKLPLSLRLVREIHGQLMKGVRGDRATPGEFRRSRNCSLCPSATGILERLVGRLGTISPRAEYTPRSHPMRHHARAI